PSPYTTLFRSHFPHLRLSARAETPIRLNPSLRLPALQPVRTGRLAGPENLTRHERVRHLAGHAGLLLVVAVVAEVARSAEQREVRDVSELHEELLSSREALASRGW